MLEPHPPFFRLWRFCIEIIILRGHALCEMVRRQHYIVQDFPRAPQKMLISNLASRLSLRAREQIYL